jgi:serine/threonine protein kinase
MFSVTISPLSFPIITYQCDNPSLVENMNSNVILSRLQFDYPDAYVKVRSYVADEIDTFHNEVECLEKLQDKQLSSHSIVPKIIASGISGNCKVVPKGLHMREYTSFVTYIVMENCGTSLADLYLTPEFMDKICCFTVKPEGHSREISSTIPVELYDPHLINLYNGQFDTVFPDPIPQEDKEKVKEIVQELSKYVYHLDIHPGNFVKDSRGVIRVIDFGNAMVL